MLFENFKEESLYRYEDKVFGFIAKYEQIFNQVVNFLDRVILNLIKAYEKLIFAFISFLNATGKVMRYTTFPFHWIWIKLELNKRHENLKDLPLFQTGAHYIHGRPGAGKSTLIYHAMMDYAYFTGKASYTTEKMELARTDVYGHDYYYHQVFTPDEFYQDGKQIASFDKNRFNVIVFEEMLTRYQQRNNKTKAYNDEVLPMIASMGTQRHQGIDLFYFISQLPRNDIAIMQMLTKYHSPKIKKVFDYKNWLRTGKFSFKIAGWWINTYEINLTSGYEYKLGSKYRWFYKMKHEEDFKYFNRLNMTDEYSKLPKHKRKEMIS